MACYGLFFILFFLYQMQKIIYKSKDNIDKLAKASVENSKTINNVLLSSSPSSFFKEWFTVINEPIMHCKLSMGVLNTFVNEKINNLKLILISYFISSLLAFLYLSDDQYSLNTAYSIFYLITPIFLLFQFLDYKLIEMKTINACSVLLKESSLVIAVRFDYFYKNKKIINHYQKICQEQPTTLHEDPRLYLSYEFNNLALLGVKNNYNELVNIRVLDNLLQFQKTLMNQFDTRIFLNENYNSVFNHKEKVFV